MPPVNSGALWKEMISLGGLQRLKGRGFFRNIMVVMSGTALAQLIGFAFSPVLSRLYGPMEFGIFGSYLSVVGVLSAAATLNYTDALMLPRSDDEAAPLFLVACLSTVALAFGTGLFCLLAPGAWLQACGMGNLGRCLWFLPFSVLVLGLGQSLTSWCVRMQAFKKTSQSQIMRSLTACASQAVGGLGGPSGTGLIAGVVLADTTLAAFLGRTALAQHRPLFLASARWPILRRMAKEYRQFPIYGCPQAVMNSVSQGIPVLVLAHYYGMVTAGAYAFGIRLLQVPMNFVLTSLRQVLFQKLAHIHSTGGDLFSPFLRSTGALIAISIVPSCVGFLVAPSLFVFVFGEQWRQAGEFSRWLIFWLSPMFCNVPSSLTARILRLQRTLLLLDIALLSSRAAILVVGGIWLRSIQTVIAFSLVGAAFNIAFVIYMALHLWRGRKESHA